MFYLDHARCCTLLYQQSPAAEGDTMKLRLAAALNLKLAA
jgi:hypothetical protein